ncbi:MAG: nuclear transport factor 2 family protein [Betaproteobacteria bacterium]
MRPPRRGGPRQPGGAAGSSGLSSLAVEDAIYEALARADVDALMELWSDEEDTVCIHPSGTRLLGNAAIRRSWDLILSQGGLVIIRSQLQRVAAGTLAVHNLIETVEVVENGHKRSFHMACTNAYIHGGKGWRQVLHHAAPVDLEAQPPPGQSGHAPRLLH